MKEVLVNQKQISCGEQDDHPLVYYTIGKDGFVVCGYCNTKYIYTDSTWWRDKK